MLLRTVYEKGPARSGSKLVERVKPIAQFAHVALEPDTTRKYFFKAIMAPHGLADRYDVGPFSGPDYKGWITGYP